MSSPTLERIRTILHRDLRLGADVDISPQMPLSGGQADIDSLDILLLLTSIEREFGVKIPSQSITADDFRTVATLTAYIDAQVRQQGGKSAPVAPAPPAVDYLARLPHGEGFRFISRVVEIRPGDAGHAVWSLSGQEPFFAGHFPGRPMVPGVLIAEALAQLSGLVAAPSPGSQGKLAHLDVRFEESAAPPVEIELRAKLTRTIGTLHQFDVTALTGPTVLARGSLALAISVPGGAT